jgi:D-specific alpha-keto acid dehydrogenase
MTGVTFYGCESDEIVRIRDMAPRFCIAPEIVEAPLSESNVDLARGNRCVSISHKFEVTNSMLNALSAAGVEYVSTRSIGFNHLDVDYAASVGITVGNVTYSPDSVADHTLMLMLMAVRHARSVLRRVDLYDYRLDETRGRELRDLTVGVVGVGRIGTAVVDRLRGFGCRRIVTHDSKGRAAKDNAALDELLRQSDIVTLHTPLTRDTHHLLDSRRIGQMKQGAIIVNTGRGALIDTAALITALESGRLGGAALDVVEGDEGIFYADLRNKPINNPDLLRLQRLPNVTITPHIAFDTDHALNDIIENTLINCLTFESE